MKHTDSGARLPAFLFLAVSAFLCLSFPKTQSEVVIGLTPQSGCKDSVTYYISSNWHIGKAGKCRLSPSFIHLTNIYQTPTMCQESNSKYNSDSDT